MHTIGFLRIRNELILVLAVMQICQSISHAFSAFSSPSKSAQTSNSTELMDLTKSLMEDFSDTATNAPTNAEVSRFVAAYAKNGKDLAEKREGEVTFLI